MNGMKSEFYNRVAAIIITYNPDLASVERLVSSLLEQVVKIVIVDNGSSNSRELKTLAHCYQAVEIQCLAKNVGIGEAQNIGIKAALKYHGIDFILLSDDDSEPQPDMVSKLCSTAVSKMLQGKKVAAVGPNLIDARQPVRPPFLRVKGLRMVRQLETVPGEVVEVDFLIASGSLLPVETLNEVGLMNELMFIDYVDIEWALRAKEKGFQSFGDYKAKMMHSIGDAPIIFGKQFYPSHSSLRHYYMMRNAVWLYKKPYISFQWKLVDGYKLLLKFGFYTLFAKPRLKHFKMMCKGMYDGLASNMGPFSS